MKNLGLILSIVALIGVGYLMVQGNDSVESTESAAEEPSYGSADGSLKMAYINIDTLINAYDLHKELKAKLEAKAAEIDKDLQSKGEVFKENLALFEQNAANMSPQQLQQAQAELQQSQQQYMLYREERGRELAQQEQELAQLIKEDMDAILDSMKVAQGYDFIFSFDQASNLLAANPKWDITDMVVEALNKKHAEKVQP